MLNRMPRTIQLLWLMTAAVVAQQTQQQCPSLVNKPVQNFTNCQVMMDRSRQMDVICQVYAIARITTVPSPVPSPYSIGILVTNNMQGKDEGNDRICLRMIGGSVKKLTNREHEQQELISNRYELSELMFFPLTIIRHLEVDIKFASNATVGSIQLDRSCIRSMERKWPSGKDGDPVSQKLDVSRCASRVSVLNSVATPGDEIYPKLKSDTSLLDLLTNNYFKTILILMNKLWLEEFDGTIMNLVMTLQSEFRDLPQEALKMLEKQPIRKASFPENGFDRILRGKIPLIPTLLYLDFTNCDIALIEEGAFEGVPNLETLNLSYNRLTSLPTALTDLVNLKVLVLKGNRVTSGIGFSYRANVLEPLPRLRHLDLGHMELAASEWHKVGTLGQISNLLLQECSIRHIPDLTFQNATSLSSLDLSRNPLESISGSAFLGLRNLEYLYLNECSLGQARYEAILEIFPNNTHTLNLASNGILQFRSLNRRHLDRLQYLNLSRNSISTWNTVSIIAQNHQTRSNFILDLQYNITVVSEAMVDDFKTLRGVKLGYNRYDCSSCQLPVFQNFLRMAQNDSENFTKVDFDPLAYRCSFPMNATRQVLTNVTIDPELCTEKVFNWLLKVFAPIFTIFLIITILTTVIVYNRWYVIYFIHLFRAHMEKYRHHREEANQAVFQYDAFVSYCTNDRPWILDHLIPHIEREDPKLHLCVHERDFVIGESIITNIIDCIDNSRKSIFVLSESFIRSQWCKWELLMAQHKLFEDQRDVLILITLEDIDKKSCPKLLRRLMATRTYLIWNNESDIAKKVFWSRLRQAIGECHCGTSGVHHGFTTA